MQRAIPAQRLALSKGPATCPAPVPPRRTLPLNDWLWLRGRPPQPAATGFFRLRKKKEETPGIICVGCEQRVPLWDEMEQCFASPDIQ